MLNHKRFLKFISIPKRSTHIEITGSRLSTIAEVLEFQNLCATVYSSSYASPHDLIYVKIV